MCNAYAKLSNEVDPIVLALNEKVKAKEIAISPKHYELVQRSLADSFWHELANAERWMDAGLSPLVVFLESLPCTGHPQIDEHLAAALATARQKERRLSALATADEITSASNSSAYSWVNCGLRAIAEVVFLLGRNSVNSGAPSEEFFAGVGDAVIATIGSADRFEVRDDAWIAMRVAHSDASGAFGKLLHTTGRPNE
jgi:hypothetical protein